MFAISRRVALGGTASALASLLVSTPSRATLLRGLTLEALSKASQRILVGTALEANAHWETLGGRRRIVTDTRLGVEDVIAKEAPSDSEILIRTLGGTVGDIAALVHGEAVLGIDQRCVLFLREDAAGIHRVIGMAQGHYPLRVDEQKLWRLSVSPRAPEVTPNSALAIRRLPGLELAQARTLIQEALAR